MRAGASARLLALVCVSLASLPVGVATGDEPTDDDALFRAAVTSLTEGRPAEAIADFEALADHGVVDATVSFDRGLAYVARVRVGGEQPGDLGQAAQGLVEARQLTDDRALAAEATRALGLVRAEVGRRRVRAGEAVEFDPGLALGPSFLRLLPEDAWALMAVLGSVILGIALFLWRARATAERRSRIAAIVTAALAAVVMVTGTVTTLAARHLRLTAAHGVIVSAGARPTDERGLVVANAPVLPEAAEVEILGHRAGWAQVRWGNVVAWIPAASVRAVAER